jgi:Mg2+ and Co2+ transporter CorA
MTKKESSETIFTEFFKILETQKKEIEKITKPILEGQKKAQEMTKPVMEYQQRLFMESLELQKALMENIMETTKRMLRIMSENPMKYGSGVGQGTLADDKFSEYMRTTEGPGKLDDS